MATPRDADAPTCRRLLTGEGARLTTRARLAEGGEGVLYAVETCDPVAGPLVAKIYHAPTADRARKLAAMVARPPENAVAVRPRSLAWPIDLLCARREDEARVVGFLMPRIEGRRPLADLLSPAARRRAFPSFTYRHLVCVARNLALVVGQLHECGYVIGDLNESNILVGDDTLVTLVDTDSFQVQDPWRRRTFRCRVGRPELTAPELMGHPFGTTPRTVDQDAFSLAVLLFRLLMEGTHPFAAAWREAGEPPALESRIAKGQFTYGSQRGSLVPAPGAPPVWILAPQLRELFVACFERGHRAPAERPPARCWQAALDTTERGLAVCGASVRHWHSAHLRHCPWCQRAESLGGHDPFAPPAPVREESRLSLWPGLAAYAMEACLNAVRRTTLAAACARYAPYLWWVLGLHLSRLVRERWAGWRTALRRRSATRRELESRLFVLASRARLAFRAALRATARRAAIAGAPPVP